MSARFFLDTNIFVYSLDRNSPVKSQKASKLVREGLTTQKGIVSYQVIQEFLNVALKRSQQPIKTADAEFYLVSILYPLLSVHSSQALFADALRLHDGNALAWYDSLIVAAAIQAKCEILYTEDLHHGQKFGALKVVNPFL